MKNAIIITVLLSFLTSCIRPINLQEQSLLNVMTSSKLEGRGQALLMGDYKSLKQYSRSRLMQKELKTSSDTLACIDLSLRENRNLVYIFQFETLPALLYIDSSGNVDRLVYLSKEAYTKDHVFSMKEKEYIKTLSDLLFNKESETERYPEDFLYNYLVSQSLKEKKDSAKLYAYRAMAIYNGDNFFSPLYNDLILRYSPKGELATQGETIVLPELKPNEFIETTFDLCNMGDTPLLIQSVSASCSCISVQYPERILAHRSEPVIIGYQAGDIPGPVNQSITIILNTDRKIHRFKICGLITK